MAASRAPHNSGVCARAPRAGGGRVPRASTAAPLSAPMRLASGIRIPRTPWQRRPLLHARAAAPLSAPAPASVLRPDSTPSAPVSGLPCSPRQAQPSFPTHTPLLLYAGAKRVSVLAGPTKARWSWVKPLFPASSRTYSLSRQVLRGSLDGAISFYPIWHKMTPNRSRNRWCSCAKRALKAPLYLRRSRKVP